jgi:hypothetical protein
VKLGRWALPVLLVAACGGGQSVFTLEVGTCFDDQGEGQISSVPAVDCAEAHDNEVFALIDYAQGESFPGDSAIMDAGRRLCIEQFEPFVGTDYQDSVLEVFAITPTEQSWEDGDREIICALYNMDLSKLTGSMRGTAR